MLHEYQNTHHSPHFQQALSLDELLDAPPENLPLPTTPQFLSNTPADLKPLDIDNNDSFYFVRDIEKSYPKMNILRGRQQQQLKENKSAASLLSLKGKGLKPSVQPSLKQQP
jgi:hypothetical protein